MSRLFRILVLAGSVLACVGLAEKLKSRPFTPDLNSLATSSADYRLGGGDLIEISVYGVQSYNHRIRVAASGVIRLPLIGEVLVEGKTAKELEAELEGLLREDIIQDPTVSVFTVEHKSRTFFVLGAVRQPGQFQIIKQVQVIDVLTMAGGLAASAGDELLIQRRQPYGAGGSGAQAAPDILRVDLKELINGGDHSMNTLVEDGDIITIPERIIDQYYIIGEINQSGGFDLTGESPILASQALARAGGALKTAKTKKAVLIRFGEGQERERIALNFHKIFDGESSDPVLKPNDIIFVPGSVIKGLGYGVLDALPVVLVRGLLWY